MIVTASISTVWPHFARHVSNIRLNSDEYVKVTCVAMTLDFKTLKLLC